MAEDVKVKFKVESDVSGVNVVLGSYQALKMEQKFLIDQLKSMKGSDGLVLTADQIDKIKARLSQLTPQVKAAEKEMRSFGTTGRLSLDRILERGENIVTVAAGAYAVAKGIMAIASAMKQTIQIGAEFGVRMEIFEQTAGSVEKAREELDLLNTAAAGNMDKMQLLENAAMMRELGYSAGETAVFLDIVEGASDKLGVSMEKGNGILTRYLETGRGRTLYTMGLSLSDINKKIKEQTGLTEKQVKELDTEDQKLIRLNAVMALYGRSLTDISQKTQDSADRIAGMQNAIKNAEYELGNFTAKALVGFADMLGITDKKMESFAIKAIGVGTALGTILPIVAQLKIAFPALGASLAAASGPFTVFAGTIAYSIAQLQTLIDILKGGNVFEALSNNWIGSLTKSIFGLEEKNAPPKTSKELGITEGNEYVEGIVKGFQDKKQDAINKLSLEKSIDDVLNKGNKTKAPKSSGIDKIAVEDPKKTAENIVKNIQDNMKGREIFIPIGVNPQIAEEIKKIVAEQGIDLQVLQQTLEEQYAQAEEERKKAEEERKKKIEADQREWDQNIALAQNVAGVIRGGFTDGVDALKKGIEIARQIALYLAAQGIATKLPGALGLLGSIFSLFPFEAGGYTGYGSTSTVAGYVHKDEYVVPSHMRALFPVLEAIRTRSGALNRSLNGYAAGGYVAGGGMMNPIINVSVETEVETVKGINLLDKIMPSYNDREAKRNLTK